MTNAHVAADNIEDMIGIVGFNDPYSSEFWTDFGDDLYDLSQKESYTFADEEEFYSIDLLH